jgi:hypothetical protein
LTITFSPSDGWSIFFPKLGGLLEQERPLSLFSGIKKNGDTGFPTDNFKYPTDNIKKGRDIDTIKNFSDNGFTLFYAKESKELHLLLKDKNAQIFITRFFSLKFRPKGSNISAPIPTTTPSSTPSHQRYNSDITHGLNLRHDIAAKFFPNAKSPNEGIPTTNITASDIIKKVEKSLPDGVEKDALKEFIGVIAEVNQNQLIPVTGLKEVNINYLSNTGTIQGSVVQTAGSGTTINIHHNYASISNSIPSTAPVSSQGPLIKEHDLRSIINPPASKLCVQFNNKQGGYNPELFLRHNESSFKDYLCCLCHGVLRQPRTATDCGHVFCLDCITSHFITNTSCPGTGHSSPLVINQAGQIAPVKMLQRHISELEAKCEHSAHGCPWKGKFGEEGSSYIEHLSRDCARTATCPYCHAVQIWKNLESHVKSNCPEAPQQCDNQGCHTKLVRKNIAQHKANDCPYQLESCDYCGNKVARGIREIEHQPACDHRPVECPYCHTNGIRFLDLSKHYESCRSYPSQCRDCGSEVVRGFADAHADECVERMIQCNDGCSVEYKRKNQDEHDKEYVHQHLRVLKKKVERLESINFNEIIRIQKEMETRLDNLTKLQGSPVELRSPKIVTK